MICRICNNEFNPKDDPVLNLLLRDALPENIRIPFYWCHNCENISTSEALDESFHLKRYKNHKTTKYTREKLKKYLKIRDYRQDKLNKQISRNIIRMVPKIVHDYLEVGCAEGSLLKTLKKKTGWSLQGVEIDTAFAEYAINKGLKIINKPYSKELFPRSSKTIISIHETLDHFHSIKEVLNSIKYHLSPEGFLTVVNTIYRWDAEQRKNKFHHTTYFTHTGIINMFEINGFDVIGVFNLPLPRLRRISAVIRGNASRYHYDRFWTKHLFIAQKREESSQAETVNSIMHWKWYKRRYKLVPK